MTSSSELRFSINQLILVGKQQFSEADFDVIQNKDLETSTTINYDGKDEVLQIKRTTKEVFENRFIAISFEEGGRYPYSEKVIHSHDLSETQNPRPPEDFEMNDQVFVLIDIRNQRILTSEQRQRKYLTAWLSEKLGKQVFIKPLFAEEDFIDKIHILKEISLTVEPHAFALSDTLSLPQALGHDVFGYGAASGVLKLRYKKAWVSEIMRGKIQSLWEGRNSCKNITIVGKSIDGIEMVLNTNELVHKISICPSVDSKTQKFVPADVFWELVQKVKNYDV